MDRLRNREKFIKKKIKMGKFTATTRNVLKSEKYTAVRFTNFVYFCITQKNRYLVLRKGHHFLKYTKFPNFIKVIMLQSY